MAFPEQPLLRKGRLDGTLQRLVVYIHEEEARERAPRISRLGRLRERRRAPRSLGIVVPALALILLAVGTMHRPFCLILILLLIGGCRESEAPLEAGVATRRGDVVEATPPPPAVRDMLDAINPAVPLWSGARSTEPSIRKEGSATIIDLWSDDPFPMVWHYYVTYLAQYRGWEPLEPFPQRDGEARHLHLDLNEVMQDPFIPGTGLAPEDDHVVLLVREDTTSNRVNIRYVIQPERDRADPPAEPSPLDRTPSTPPPSR